MLKQNNRKTSKNRTISRALLSLVLVVSAFILVINKQFIVDQILVWQYQPTSEISNLIGRAGLNDYGQFLFYASQPTLDGTQNFNTECNRVESSTSILGCYKDNKIYIYDVTDTKLDGIREVTAVHEMLHAAYSRLSDSDKKKVNELLEVEYTKLENNKEFTDLVAYYASSEPGQRDNELHSMIGTEVADISPELETYYQKYFSDRQLIVAFNTKYISVFQSLKDQATMITTQLTALSSSISSAVAQYNTDAATLNSDINSFNTRADNGDFSSQSQFYNERYLLSSRVTSLNTTRNNIQVDIAEYNSLLDQYNSIASESQKLYNTIDSTMASAPSV